jgi:hypothetical protein
VEEKSACRILLGNTEEKRPLEVPRCRRGDDIKMDLRMIGLSVRATLIRFRIGAIGVLFSIL